MKNKILLVDDEKVFLTSLKEGLENLEDIFITDICFSVKEAIALIKKNDYILIITDIRMPNKSGIDLLIHLREIKFKGNIKVMSAHKTEENIQRVKGLGIIDVISKPFDLDWFQNMLIDFFEKEVDADVSFEAIDLISVLQVINLDKKSVVLQIDNEGEKGLIYFKDGEIVNAEYMNFNGEEAVLKIIELRRGNISVKKLKNKIKKIINIPFTILIMNSMKKIDETRNGNKNKTSENEENDEELQIEYEQNIDDQDIFDNSLNEEDIDEVITLESKIDSEVIKNKEEENMSTMNDMLTILNNEVNGLKTASIFGRDGLPLAVENPGGLDIEAFSAKFAMVNALVAKTVKDLSNGTLNEILVEEDKGWSILRPLGTSGLSLFIAVNSNATLGNLRLVAKKLAADAEKIV